MKGTFKIRNKKGECLCALFTEDYVFYNVLMDKRSKELFKDYVNDAYITISDLEPEDFTASPQDIVIGKLIQDNIVLNRFVEEFYLISLETAFSCKDLLDFLTKCKELPDGSKEENGNG